MLKPSRLFVVLSVLAVPVAMGGSPDLSGDPTAVLSLPDTMGNVGDTLRIPLDIVDADSIQAALIEIAYEPAMLTPRTGAGSIQLGAFGQSIEGPGWTAFIPTPGVLRLVFVTGDVIGYVGSGRLLTFEIVLVGEGFSPLTFDSITLEQLPDRTLPAMGDNGSVDVGPAAVEEGSWGRVKHRYAGVP